MLVKEWFRRRAENQELVDLSRRIDSWHTSEAGVIGLFSGKGLLLSGIVGRKSVSNEERRMGLATVAERYIRPVSRLDSGKIDNLREMFTEGVMGIAYEGGLLPISERTGYSQSECFELLKQGFEIVRNGYRSDLDKDWKERESGLQSR